MKIGRAVTPAQPLAVGVLQSEPAAWAIRPADRRITMVPNAADASGSRRPGAVRGRSCKAGLGVGAVTIWEPRPSRLGTDEQTGSASFPANSAFPPNRRTEQMP